MTRSGAVGKKTKQPSSSERRLPKPGFSCGMSCRFLLSRARPCPVSCPKYADKLKAETSHRGMLSWSANAASKLYSNPACLLPFRWHVADTPLLQARTSLVSGPPQQSPCCVLCSSRARSLWKPIKTSVSGRGLRAHVMQML